MSIAAAAATTSSAIPLGSHCCHCCRAEGIACSTLNGMTNSWIRSPSDIHKVSDHSGLSFRCENPYFGLRQSHLLPNRHQSCDLKVSVAADYSDSLPDSSNFVGDNGYHPLEELGKSRIVRVTKLADAEIAKTAIEANSRALLLFPGIVHSEPHEQVSWAEYHYVVDEFGDLFFEIYEDENILQERDAMNPVNALVGMGIPQYRNRRINSSDYSILESGYDEDIISHHDFEFENSEMSDVRVDFGMPENSSWVHPVYFAKCLEKVVNDECLNMMDHPSNGVSLWGHLRPAYVDEEAYLRRLFNDEDSDDSSWADGESVNSRYNDDRSCRRSTIYRFEIIKVELYSVYGVQLEISLDDFEDAEPDVLVHSAPALLEQFSNQGTRWCFALKTLCKKKGLLVEGASLIGIDSLGIDVRVYSGSEVLTHRFPFKVRATSESAAEKQIQQLLLPRSRRKRYRAVEKSSDQDLF